MNYKLFDLFSKFASPNLENQLNNIRERLAEAAQSVVDNWDEEEIGSGGICDQVANMLSEVIAANIEDVEIIDGGHDGDDHAWIVVFNDDKAYGVDISPYVYEIGGGYSWKKIDNAKIKPNDIDIWEINREDIESDSDY